MAVLKVLQNGQLLKEISLQPGETYYAGRSEQCQIVLPSERGISRQHLKISEESGLWVATKMSKYGALLYGGQSVEVVPLDTDLSFIIEPYEFIFEVQPRHTEAEPVSELAAQVEPAPRREELEPAQDTSPGNFEATRAGASHLVAYLKIYNQNNQHEEVLKLEGQAWTLGRSPNCEIYINDTAISRKHLELRHSHEGYFVVDCESSNGSELNGEMLTPHTPYQLRSGDVIQIKNIRLSFEIRNTEFEKMLQNLPALIDEAEPESTPQHTQIRSNLVVADSAYGPSESDLNPGPGVIKVKAPTDRSAFLKDRKIQILIGFIFITLFWFFTDSPQPSNNKPEGGQQELGSRKEVTAQQMQVVKEKYELAKKNYFERANYTFCVDLLNEVHQIVPFFEDSKNLASLCQQSIELKMIREEREEKERKKAEAESKIRATLENCKSIYKPDTTTAQMQECLGPALELDPGNVEAQVLLKQIEDRDLKNKEVEASRKQIAQLALKGQQHFSRASRLEADGRLRSALQEYTSFMQKSYPGLRDEQERARRSISSIQKALSQKIIEKVNVCKNLIAQNQYKNGIKACDQALSEDPQNSTALEAKKTAISKMQKEFRSVYEDSRLEESMGNIEAAKQKWQKIKDESFPGEEFYEKAKSKLKKYEG